MVQAWRLPLLLCAIFVLLRVGAPSLVEKPELLWLDGVLDLRARAGRSEALDPRIRFVELKTDEALVKRWAEKGEYATTGELLKTIATLKPDVIAVDVVYAHGREQDQRALAEAIREIHRRGSTRVVLSTSIEERTDPPYLLRSLPRAGGSEFVEGIVNVPDDRHWRKYRYVHRFGGESFPSLALAAFGASRSPALAPRLSNPGVMEWTELDDGRPRTRRVDDSPRLLNWRHSYYDNHYDQAHLPQLGRRVWSVSQLEDYANSQPESSLLEGTIVFLGFDAETDGKTTTHGPLEPGMYVHGTALNDLIRRSSISRASPVMDALLFLAVALLAGLLFASVRRKAWLLLASATGILAILGFTSWALVSPALLLLPAGVAASLLWTIAVFCEVGRRWTLEARERTRRDAMLGFYFSPAVLKQVTKDLDMIRPRGGDVAVLLSDLRGFTSLCENIEVERVFELLNRLFAVETEATLREDGSLARFAGDQFLAYWGAPEPCEDAADRALRAALSIQQTLAERRKRPDPDELDRHLAIGIGLHFGRGLVGHVGSRSYRDYNLVGDCVNTTARIEGQTKNYGAAILASGEFLTALQKKPVSLLVDRVQVKGKSRPTELHAIFQGEAEAEGRELYAAAFRHYEGGDFARAERELSSLTNHPNPIIAKSASLLAGRCRQLAAQPPASWAGIFELTTK